MLTDGMPWYNCSLRCLVALLHLEQRATAARFILVRKIQLVRIEFDDIASEGGLVIDARGLVIVWVILLFRMQIPHLLLQLLIRRLIHLSASDVAFATLTDIIRLLLGGRTVLEATGLLVQGANFDVDFGYSDERLYPLVGQELLFLAARDDERVV